MGIFPTGTINITTPAGGENWKSGAIKTLTWTLSGTDPNKHLTVLYFAHGIWNQIRIVSGTTTSTNWKVPIIPPTTTAKIKVMNTVTDDFSSSFTIST